jgi:hypothetical protein
MPMVFPQNEDLTSPQTFSNPLQVLEQNGYNVASFVYPIDLTTDPGENHMIIFYINENKHTQYTTNPSPSNPISTGFVGPVQPNNLGVVPVNAATATNATAFSGTNSNGNVTNFTGQQTNRVSTVIAMYVPPNVQTTYQTSWDVQEFGAFGGVVKALTGQDTSISRALKEMGIGIASSLAADAKDFAQTFGGVDVDVESAVSFGARALRNPHMEMLFRGIGFREFQFDFKFTPRSQQEAMNVSNIIKAFKFYSAPEVKHGTDDARYYLYPAEFDIEFWSAGQVNTFINKISTCACTNVTVTYTGSGGWSSFRPGAIIGMGVETNMSLQFKELEIITRARILSGF